MAEALKSGGDKEEMVGKFNGSPWQYLKTRESPIMLDHIDYSLPVEGK
jgi:hypothetical protein